MKSLAEVENVSPWAVPDMSLVNNGRRAAVPMPSEMFGPAWAVITDVADVTSTAPDYAAIAYIASAASLIGGKRRIAPYNGDWSEPCILWCGALGDPSSRKSAPLDRMTKPLWKIQENARLDHEADKRDWMATVERAKAEKAKWQDEVKGAAGTDAATPDLPTLAVEPDEPAERCPIISDVTPEAAASVLKGNPQGVLCYNDELSGWLEGFDKYTSGGRPFWLSAFGGRPHSITRKGSGSISIKFNGISVLGSIQPDKLVPLIDGANDGLVPRILWAWPEKQLPRRPTRSPDMTELLRAYERLEMLNWGSDAEGGKQAITLPLTDDAADMFHAWEVENAASDGDGGSLYESFVGKMSGAALRLALVSEFSEWAFSDGPEPATISKRAVYAALTWVEDYAKPMAQRVYGDAAVSVADRNAALLARYVRRHKLELLNLRDLRRSPHKPHLKPLQPKNALEDAVEVMLDAGWLLPAFQRDGPNAGQQRKDYRVNPAAMGAK